VCAYHCIVSSSSSSSYYYYYYHHHYRRRRSSWQQTRKWSARKRHGRATPFNNVNDTVPNLSLKNHHFSVLLVPEFTRPWPLSPSNDGADNKTRIRFSFQNTMMQAYKYEFWCRNLGEFETNFFSIIKFYSTSLSLPLHVWPHFRNPGVGDSKVGCPNFNLFNRVSDDLAGTDLFGRKLRELNIYTQVWFTISCLGCL